MTRDNRLVNALASSVRKETGLKADRGAIRRYVETSKPSPANISPVKNEKSVTKSKVTKSKFSTAFKNFNKPFKNRSVVKNQNVRVNVNRLLFKEPAEYNSNVIREELIKERGLFLR